MVCTASPTICAATPVAGGAQALPLGRLAQNNPGLFRPSTSDDAVSAVTQASTSSHPQRKPQSNSLTPDAHVWLARLPPRYQPLATARRHPHIVNRLAEVWDTPIDLHGHFRELMLSSRPERRKGFAFEVLTELADLQAMVELIQKGERP